VLEGQLTLAEERDGTVLCTSTLVAGDTIFVPPWTVHGHPQPLRRAYAI
jgi:quercetin dioxygenase-like cupin family protein